jgi:hypothetical protein
MDLYYQNDVLLDKLTPENGLTFNESKINGTLRFYLHLAHVDSTQEGEYTCHFENRLGSDNQTFQLYIDDNGGFNGARIAIIVVLIIILILLMLVARIFYVRFSVANPTHFMFKSFHSTFVLGTELTGP